MYELTKIYKTKAMAVNAIRMTATNKGWKVLSTDEAATHVWPQAEGFAVNNTTLNLALGFITEAEASVAEALAEAKPVSKQDAKAQQVRDELYGKDGKGSQEGAIKKVAKANAKKPAKEKPADVEPCVFPGTKQTRCNVVNGARRPLRGKTLLVWEVTERLHSQLERVPSMKEVHEQLVSMEPGFNKTTTGIQYYACKAYNGWTK